MAREHWMTMAMATDGLLPHGLGHLLGLTHQLCLIGTRRRHILWLCHFGVGVSAMAGTPRGTGAKATRVLLRVGLIATIGGTAAIASGSKARATCVVRLRHVLIPPLGGLLRLLQVLLRVLGLGAQRHGLAPALSAGAAAKGVAGVGVARPGCCGEQEAYKQGTPQRHHRRAVLGILGR